MNESSSTESPVASHGPPPFPGLGLTPSAGRMYTVVPGLTLKPKGSLLYQEECKSVQPTGLLLCNK